MAKSPQKNPEPVTVQLTISEDDASNLVAFGNRASMSGVEADTWVDLKRRIGAAVRQAREDRRVGGIAAQVAEDAAAQTDGKVSPAELVDLVNNGRH